MSDDFVEPTVEPTPAAEPLIEYALQDDVSGAYIFGVATESTVPVMDGWTRVDDVNGALRENAIMEGTARAAGDAALAAAKELGAQRQAEAEAAQRSAILELAGAGGFDPVTLAAALGQSHVLTPADVALPPSEEG